MGSGRRTLALELTVRKGPRSLSSHPSSISKELAEQALPDSGLWGGANMRTHKHPFPCLIRTQTQPRTIAAWAPNPFNYYSPILPMKDAIILFSRCGRSAVSAPAGRKTHRAGRVNENATARDVWRWISWRKRPGCDRERGKCVAADGVPATAIYLGQ